MWISGQWVFLIAMIILAESATLFIYTVIGLLKQNPGLDILGPPPVPFGYFGCDCDSAPVKLNPYVRGQQIRQPDSDTAPDISVSISTVTSVVTMFPTPSSETLHDVTTTLAATTVPTTIISSVISTVTLSAGASDGSSDSSRSSTRSATSAHSEVPGVAYQTTNVFVTVDPTKTDPPKAASTKFMTVTAAN